MLNPGVWKCSVFAGEWDDFRGFPVWSLFWPLIMHNTFWHTFFLYVLFVIIQIQSTSIIWCLNKWPLNALVLYLFAWSVYTLDSLNLSRLAFSSNPQHIQVTAVVASHFDSFPPEENENCSSRRVCVSLFLFCADPAAAVTRESWVRHAALNCFYINQWLIPREISRPAVSRLSGCHLAAERSTLSSWIIQCDAPFCLYFRTSHWLMLYPWPLNKLI